MVTLPTDIYCKPTDTRQCLNYESYHPPHVKCGIPYNQVLRLKRIRQSDEVFEKTAIELKEYLVKTGFWLIFGKSGG